MDWPRRMSLVVAGLYAVVAVIAFLTDDTANMQDLLQGLGTLTLWLAVCLGCIWWGDELGEGLAGARFGLVSSSSPGWAVKLMGWVLLLLPAVIGVVYALQGD